MTGGDLRTETNGTRGIGLAAIAVTVLVVLAFGAPMFSVPDGIASGDPFRDNDWLNNRSFDLLARMALLDQGEFPLRSPLVGGGFPTIAHPSDGSWAPTMLAVLLFGDVLGVKINLLLALLVGCWGIHGLARRWLGLTPPASLFAALLFGVSGWLPSILLVGDYHKTVYMLVPACLLLLSEADRNPRKLLGAGLLLALVIQQGGFGFPAIVFFLGLWTLLAATPRPAEPESASWPRVGAAVLLLVLVLWPMGALIDPEPAIAPAVLAWGIAAFWCSRSSQLQQLGRTLAPDVTRLLLVLLITCCLGAGRIAGLAYLGAHGANYSHGPELISVPLLPVPDAMDMPPQADEPDAADPGPDEFYGSLVGIVRGRAQRVPAGAPGRAGDTASSNRTEAEHGWLGLTWAMLPLVLLGLAFPGPRRAQLAATLLLAVGICVGPLLPLDLHASLTGGLPFLRSVGQPVKYFSFFILLTAVLLAGAGLDRGVARVPERARRALWVLAFGLLLVPFTQNRTALAELFAIPVRAEPAAEFEQVLQVGSEDWIDWPLVEIRTQSDQLGLREYARPAAASEYPSALAGVGVIDWYGTVVLPEHAVPAGFVLPRGERIPNPAYQGEAWFAQGDGTVETVSIRPNTIELQVQSAGAATLVINQSWLDGFVSDDGEIGAVTADGVWLPNNQGLVGVRLAERGPHTLRLRYRPALLLGGLAVSGLSLLLWCGLWWWLPRRSRDG